MGTERPLPSRESTRTTTLGTFQENHIRGRLIYAVFSEGVHRFSARTIFLAEVFGGGEITGIQTKLRKGHIQLTSDSDPVLTVKVA